MYYEVVDKITFSINYIVYNINNLTNKMQQTIITNIITIRVIISNTDTTEYFVTNIIEHSNHGYSYMVIITAIVRFVEYVVKTIN